MTASVTELYNTCSCVAYMKDNAILLVKRGDGQGWCFPGGKLEEGETYEQGAKREFSEETGVECSGLRYIGNIYAIADMHGTVRYTETHMYIADGISSINFNPVDHKEIENVRFIALADLPKLKIFMPTSAGISRILEQKFKR